MVDAPSMNLTNNAVDSRLRRRSFNPLLKKLRVLLKLRRTRFSEPSLSLDKSRLRLTEELLRRKKNSTTPARTTDVPWSLSRLPLNLSSVPRLRVLESRRTQQHPQEPR